MKSIKQKLVLLLVILFLHNIQAPVYSANWVEVVPKYYIDINSIRAYKDPLVYSGNSKKYTYWVKILNNNQQIFKNIEKSFNTKVWYIKEMSVMDCDNRRVATKAYVDYDLNAMSIFSEEISPYLLNYKSIIPESIGEILYNYICGVY